jgi:hygromycin-B 4-O-kinase
MLLMNSLDPSSLEPGMVAAQHAIREQLAVPRLDLRPLQGGTNDRTFLATYREQAWIVRFEAAGGLQLRRAYAAQMLARQAGVAVPEIVAARLDADELGAWQWMVEQRVQGVHFVPPAFERGERNALAFDLGRQLRALHAVAVDEFGLFPPDPWGINRPTFAAWIDREAARVAPAAELAGMRSDMVPRILEAYAMLRDGYADRPRLCHGDCATTNILVDGGRVSALIDWEWAKGGDPAANIAYWAFWQDDREALDALLGGYGAGAPGRIRARVLAYHIVTAVDLIHVYHEHGSTDDIRMCRRTLESALEAGAWAQDGL